MTIHKFQVGSAVDTSTSSSSSLTKISLKPVKNLSLINDIDDGFPEISPTQSSQVTQPISTGSGSVDEDDTNGGLGITPENGSIITKNVPVPAKKKRPGLSLDIEPDRHTSDEIVQVFDEDRSHP
jgi:hypothetical protein